MKKTLVLALLALGAAAVAAYADGPAVERNHVEHKIHVKIAADDDLLDLDLSDLEIGESKQLYTDSGKEIVVTRSDEGYEIQVEGRDEPIVVRSGHHAHAYAIDHECDPDEDCLRNVMIKKKVIVGGGDTEDAHSMVFISDDGELHTLGEGEGHTWVSAHEGHGGAHVVRLGGEGAIERLLASGALDSLDEAKRQEILDALRGDDESFGMRVKVIEKHRHDDDQ